MATNDGVDTELAWLRAKAEAAQAALDLAEKKAALAAAARVTQIRADDGTGWHDRGGRDGVAAVGEILGRARPRVGTRDPRREYKKALREAARLRNRTTSRRRSPSHSPLEQVLGSSLTKQVVSGAVRGLFGNARR
ncbi:hypothetical protein [Microbacterium halotolerans]|uniref:hypothetical protein n=1 Tax=Microbacterium halotolerans TaxID=246613 RepID=UPI000E6AA898|nr:hypothetical protein [Microbacterium halotolerans]